MATAQTTSPQLSNMNATHVAMDTKVRAMSAVVHFLDTDLTSERCARSQGDDDAWSFEWGSFHGGDHRVTTTCTNGAVVRSFRVDLVLGKVTTVAGRGER